MSQPGSTNDHIVPVMYLKRFAIPRPGGHQIKAAPVDTPAEDFMPNVKNVGAEKGFYWGVDPEGVPHHQMEELLGLIEAAATPAFRYLLDHGKGPADDALPYPWPTRPDVRAAVAWWLAAQLLRTAPHRERLWQLHGEAAAPPRDLSRANPHLQFTIDGIAPLAAVLMQRPWGFGFTSLCLFTSDVPVQILNATEDDDPVVAATFWDMYVPLDAHRFLFLPGRMHADQPDLMRDHRFNLPGGMAIILNQLVVETAHRHLFWHPEHDPRPRSELPTALRIRASRKGSTNVLWYDTLDDLDGIERRWLDKHLWDDGKHEPAAEGEASQGKSKDEVTALLETMIEQHRAARAEFDQATKPEGSEGGPALGR